MLKMVLHQVQITMPIANYYFIEKPCALPWIAYYGASLKTSR